MVVVLVLVLVLGTLQVKTFESFQQLLQQKDKETQDEKASS